MIVLSVYHLVDVSGAPQTSDTVVLLTRESAAGDILQNTLEGF